MIEVKVRKKFSGEKNMKPVWLTLSAGKVNPACPKRRVYLRCWRSLTMNRRSLLVLFGLMVVILIESKSVSAQQPVAR